MEDPELQHGLHTEWVIYWLPWWRSSTGSIKPFTMAPDSHCVLCHASLCKPTKIRPAYWHHFKDRSTLTFVTQTANWTTDPHYVRHKLNYNICSHTLFKSSINAEDPRYCSCSHYSLTNNNINIEKMNNKANCIFWLCIPCFNSITGGM